MQNVVLVIHLLLALSLIGVVLLQRSEGGGLGMGGGGGGGGGVMSGRAAATALGKLTWLFAIAFIGTSVALTVISAQKSGGTSVIDQLGGDAPTADAPALPEGDSLLPPTTGDQPLAPARQPSSSSRRQTAMHRRSLRTAPGVRRARRPNERLRPNRHRRQRALR